MAMTLPLPPQNMPAEVYSYLFQMVQLLNLSVDAISTGTTVNVSGAVSGAVSGETSGETGGSYDELRSLIIKTADNVSHEIERMDSFVRENYVAQSEFGVYTQELSRELEDATPDAITQYYSFYSKLQANIDGVMTALNDYTVNTEGYIRTGIVAYENGVPMLGVAVGQNLSSTTTDIVNGQEFPVVEEKNFRAVFTAQKLSFFQDSTEVAYLSNNKLYITNSTVLENLQIGEWAVSSTNGLAFKWIGG